MTQKSRLEIGKRIRRLRQAADLSQEELGDIAGVHRTYVSVIERGEKSATLEVIEKIAKALKVKLEELFKGL